MHELCSITLCQADDSTARLRVETAAGKEQRQWSGRLRGPYCKAARTLAADFPIAADGTLLVTEPCYWTPRLPFTYELQAIAEAPGRGAIELQETVGMRRLEARGRHLLWERRRIVLRGARVDNPANEVLAEAREFEIALLVADPTADFCKQASAQGVPLIADFRNCSGNLPVDVASAARYPAVAAALVDGRQVDATVRFPTDAMLAQAVYPDGVSQLAP